MKGKILGSRYRVIEYIAEGGFGRTYLAEDTLLPDQNHCVVKQLSPTFNASRLLAVARRLFETEAKALHNLGHHAQIPELLAYFEEAEKLSDSERNEKQKNSNWISQLKAQKTSSITITDIVKKDGDTIIKYIFLTREDSNSFIRLVNKLSKTNVGLSKYLLLVVV